VQERKKVIIVDDDPVNLETAAYTLKDSYDVFPVPGAERLFWLLEFVRPDIILLDVVMPGIDGYEAISILKKDHRAAHVPVIFLTAATDPQSESTGLRLGARDYISKPFSPPILRKRIENHLLIEEQKKSLERANADLRRMVEEKTMKIVVLQSGILKILGNLVEYRDDVTGSHIERTEKLLSFLLDEMIEQGVYHNEIESWDVSLLVRSAYLHDVGKISIHDGILLKPGPLTQAEFLMMQKHVLFGERIIDNIARNTKENIFLHHAKMLTGAHHEKWNGSGYPRGIAGGEIPLQGRLMAVVDVYDALTSERPYKKPMTPDKAMDIIKRGTGVHFDPVVVDAFISAARHFM